MRLEDFVDRARASLPVGYVFDNPRAGTSRIVASSRRRVCYQRRNSRIYVRWSDLHAAYVRFAGRRMSSSDLREEMPSVFDSSARPAGHSCNCTFLFHVLKKLARTTGALEGRGVAGDPCGVGGLSHGFRRVGFPVVAGIDVDRTCKHAFETNNDARFIGKSIEAVSGSAQDRRWPDCIRRASGAS